MGPIYYNLAGLHVKSLSEKKGNAGADLSAASAGELLEQTFEYLQQACDLGFFSNPEPLEDIKRNPCLDVLRKRPEYKKLLEKIAARTKPDGKPIDKSTKP